MKKLIYGFQDLIGLMRAHPILSAAFAFLFGMFSALVTKPAWEFTAKCAIVVLLGLFAACVYRGLGKKRSIALVLLTTWLIMITPRIQADEPPPPVQQEQVQEAWVAIAIGIVVIVIAVVVVVKVVNFCEDHFPRTNSPPNQRFVLETEYSASFNYQCSCACQPPTGPPTTFFMSGEVSGTNIAVTMTASGAPEFRQSLYETQLEVESHGITLEPFNSSYYARDGTPMAAEDSPIQFKKPTQTVTVHEGGKKVRIERSEDLREWRTLVVVDVPDGRRIDFSDTTGRGQQFYRMMLVE